jgi:hypothetical protein
MDQRTVYEDAPCVSITFLKIYIQGIFDIRYCNCSFVRKLSITNLLTEYSDQEYSRSICKFVINLVNYYNVTLFTLFLISNFRNAQCCKKLLPFTVRFSKKQSSRLLRPAIIKVDLSKIICPRLLCPRLIETKRWMYFTK